jgi:sulfite reductase beta subunit-like hemoprotein
MAELGFVGDGPNSYQFWLGGSPNQTRLAEPFQDRVKIQVGVCVCSECPMQAVDGTYSSTGDLHH